MVRPLISVVVPVYKVEAFLDRCVESIRAQSYSRLEIVLVDDGSPDRCPALCDAWAARDERIRVLHKENGGLSDARNRGMELVTGDYVLFVDSDDYLAPDAVEYLLSLLESGETDLAVGGYRIVHGSDEVFSGQTEGEPLRFSPEEACLALMGYHYTMPLVTAWGKLIPAEIVRANPFPKGRLHEDEATTFRYYDQCRGVVLGGREIYAYYQNPGSITHTPTERNRRDALLAFEEQVAYFGERGEERLRLGAADRLLNVLVDLADKGDPVCRRYLDQGRAAPYLLPGTRLKTRIRYRGWQLFRKDLNKSYHRILGR